MTSMTPTELQSFIRQAEELSPRLAEIVERIQHHPHSALMEINVQVEPGMVTLIFGFTDEEMDVEIPTLCLEN